MGLGLEYEEGQTPLDEDELEGILISSVSTQNDLNEQEQLNIQQAQHWILTARRKPEKILTEAFIVELHAKMFGQVWKWAGTFRKSEKNIGVPWVNIPVSLRSLIDDTNFWIANKIYEPDEIAIRFKHRLVLIHCFPNGNGRHSRLMADILIERVLGQKVFSWNQSNFVEQGRIRQEYISALRKADTGSFEDLIFFARS